MRKMIATAALALFALTACNDDTSARDDLSNNGSAICSAYTDRDDC